MSEPVVVTFTIARDEYIRALQRHYHQAGLRARRDVLLAVLVIGGGSYLATRSNPGWTPWFLIGTGLTLIGMITFAKLIQPRIIYDSEPKLKGNYQLTFDDEAIRFQTDDVESTLRWSLYNSWVSDPEFYILYYGKRAMTVIPRRCFMPGDDDRFRAMLERNIKSSAS